MKRKQTLLPVFLSSQITSHKFVDNPNKIPSTEMTSKYDGFQFV